VRHLERSESNALVAAPDFGVKHPVRTHVDTEASQRRGGGAQPERRVSEVERRRSDARLKVHGGWVHALEVARQLWHIGWRKIPRAAKKLAHAALSCVCCRFARSLPRCISAVFLVRAHFGAPVGDALILHSTLLTAQTPFTHPIRCCPPWLVLLHLHIHCTSPSTFAKSNRMKCGWLARLRSC
jgi:hypothetical protein